MSDNPPAENHMDDDTSELSEEGKTFLAEFPNLPKPIFAVVDGAKFGNLPNLLSDLELDHSSLFIDHADKDVEAASGWLVPIKSEEEFTRLLKHASDCSSFVLWSCPDGEAKIHRHLRTINIANIVTGSKADGTDAAAEEKVYFRHYDPEVICSVIPVLQSPQFVRLLGPAIQITLYDAEFGEVRRAGPIENPPAMPSGLLRITDEQIARMELARQRISRARIARYLHKVAPVKAASLDDGQLEQYIIRAEKAGRSIGLRSELAIAYWTFLNLSSDANVAQDKKLLMFLHNDTGQGTADDKLFLLMKRLAEVSGEATNRPDFHV